VKLAIDLLRSSRLRARSSLIPETVPCRAALLFADVAPRYPDTYTIAHVAPLPCARWFRSLWRLCDDAGPPVLCGPCSKGRKRKKSPRARGAEAHRWVGLTPLVPRVSCGECAERVHWVGTVEQVAQMTTTARGRGCRRRVRTRSRLRCALYAVSGFGRQGARCGWEKERLAARC
jgi:hypothetical protein